MDTIDGMRTFVSVVSNGSFSRAAERLNMSPQLVSKYVGQLETWLRARWIPSTTAAIVAPRQRYRSHAVRSAGPSGAAASPSSHPDQQHDSLPISGQGVISVRFVGSIRGMRQIAHACRANDSRAPVRSHPFCGRYPHR